MITKILFTILIILAGLLFIRYKSSQLGTREPESAAQQSSSKNSALFVGIAFVSFTLAVSAATYYMHWQEQHRIYTVQVLNSHSGSEQIFHVYQGDINGRQFRTIDGRQISLSDAERMEVQEGTMGRSQ